MNMCHRSKFLVKVSMMYAKGEGTEKNPVAAKE